MDINTLDTAVEAPLTPEQLEALLAIKPEHVFATVDEDDEAEIHIGTPGESHTLN